MRTPVLALTVALLPAAASAQAALELPASFIAPNHDRVFVGVAEAHEAGAYLARTRGPAAAWYDAAGIATLEGSAASVNVRGLEAGTLSVSDGPAQFSALGVLPLYLSAVLGPDLLPWRDVRVAISGTEQTAWSTLVWWGTTGADGHRTYVSDSSLSSYVLAASAAWAASPSLRFGASLGASWTWLFENDRLSALTAGAEVESTIRTRLASGLVFHAVPSLSAQWDPVPWLAVGAVVRLPAPRLWGEATVQAERQETTSSGSQTAFQQTGQADFDYRYPLELHGGVAARRKAWELEVDVRFHASPGSYDLIASTVPVEVVTDPPGGPPAPAPFAPIRYDGRAVVDVALGGSFALSEALRLHGGLYASPSPVASGSTFFRQTDLYGARAGVSFSGERLSGSVGLGYEQGTASASPGLAGLEPTPVDDRARVRTVSLTFAAEYRR